jgi:CRP-like cAMP-binding protein
LGRETYTSGAVAEVDCAVYRIRHSELRRLCEAEPATANLFLDRLAGVIAERLRNTHNSVLDMLNQGIETNGNGGPKKDVK